MKRCKKWYVISALVLAASSSAAAYDADQQAECESNIHELASNLQVMLAKINVMPPIAEIYVPLRKLFDEAVSDQEVGDYSRCVVKTQLGLKYARPYAR